MLQLRNIRKTYITGDLTQDALKGVSISFRKNEFVAILGHSGSGKTTMLNIIGGLDQYTSGDLVINGVSTKKYKDKDWDAYRNHSIGFVFQSYNLIPHQTVLANVELALTLSGVSKTERQKRAKEALAKVGLSDHIYKRPNQMSGGQMQRVAIARALINNPDIILADEPTGALDSDTSVQVMEILKEVAKEKLVIMVTHNPELAYEYANRIVRLVDGSIVEDTVPYTSETVDVEKPKRVKNRSMSMFTAFSLSLNNLMTKKMRTFMTSFAGSIGILGIALILSVSNGFQNYIDQIQEDTLTSYPLQISSETSNAFSSILSMAVSNDGEREDGKLYEKQYMATMFSSVGKNDLKSFKHYLETHEDEYADDVTFIRYQYSISPLIYAIDAADKVVQLNPSTMMSSIYSSSVTSLMSGGGGGIYSEMTHSADKYKDDYTVLAGRWPEKYNEMLIVLPSTHTISDLLLYNLGLKDTGNFKTLMTEMLAGEEVTVDEENLVITYEDLLNLNLKLIDPSDLYRYNSEYDIYEDMTDDKDYMLDLFNRSESLKVVGLMSPVEDSNGGLSSGVNYLPDLTLHVMEKASQSELVKKQMADKEVDVFSGDRFDEDKEENNGLDFNNMISVDEKMLQEAFKINISNDSFLTEDQMKDVVMASSKTVGDTLETLTQTYNATLPLLLDGTIQAALAMSTTPVMVTPTACDVYNTNPSLGCAVVPGDEANYKEITTAMNTVVTVDTTKGYASYVALASWPMIKTMATSDTAIQTIIDTIEQQTRPSEGMEGMKLEADFLKQVMGDAFDSYFTQLVDNGMGMADTVPTDPSLASAAAIANNQEGIALQAYKMAQKNATGLAALAIAQATGEIMKPITEMFSGELFSIDTNKFTKAFNFNMNQDDLSRLMETMMSGSKEKTYSSNIQGLGYQDKDDPSSISFFFKDFESKENFMDFLDVYNDRFEEDEDKLSYMDITGLLMSSVKTIVDSVTYVLIAFVAISLVVSSIMIGVITLISVMERTKEIGILRAIGASKKDISHVFNVETFIIGLLAGLIGIGTTYILLIPINQIMHNVTHVQTLNAVLPAFSGIILIIISVVLTLISGIIPASSAAKKDPVEALRTE